MADRSNRPAPMSVRKLCEPLPDTIRCEGSSAWRISPIRLNVLIDSRDQWDLTIDEQLAYYRLLELGRINTCLQNCSRNRMIGFCRRFLKTPKSKEGFSRVSCGISIPTPMGSLFTH